MLAFLGVFSEVNHCVGLKYHESKQCTCILGRVTSGEQQNLGKLDKGDSKAFSFLVLSTHWTVWPFTVGETLGDLCSSILLQAGSPTIRSDQVAQGLIQSDLETLHGHNPSELPVPLLLCEEVPPYTYPQKFVSSSTEIPLLAISSLSFLAFVETYSHPCSHLTPPCPLMPFAHPWLLTFTTPSPTPSLCLEMGFLAFALSSFCSLNLLSNKNACRCRKIPSHLFHLNSSVQDEGWPELFHSAGNCIYWSLSFLIPKHSPWCHKKSLMNRHEE